jgi:hypothetical protein
MSTTHITPTPGRIVWYRGADGEIRPAIVTAVHGPFSINLNVFPSSSTDTMMCGARDSVTHADPEQEPSCLNSWHWMPYQKDQAKKAEDREHDAKQLAVAADRAEDAKRMRAGVLDMALRTPGMLGHADVLTAAAAYQAHIEGRPVPGSIETKTYADGTKATGPAPLPQTSPASTLQPHQQRVVDEKRDLDEKLAKLIPFFDTPIFAGLSEEEKQRLIHQEAAMQEYSTILGERIAVFLPADA